MQTRNNNGVMKMKIEIELPELEGYKYTGEFRKPRSGEYYLSKRLLRQVIAVKPPRYNCHIIKDIKPKVESLEDRVKAEYGDYEVVMLKDDRDILMMYRFGDEFKHVEAQSFKGFYRYVYQHEDGHVFEYLNPIYLRSSTDKIFTPIAVLFTKEK